jgi:porin
MRMGVLPGALIQFRAQSRFGTTVNADTGMLLPVNTYSLFPFTAETDENVPFAITELNYTQFVSDKLGFLLGKITTMNNANEFAGGEGRTQFMNFQFIYSAVFAQMAGFSTLAAGAVWQPTPRIAVVSVFINSKDASTTAGFSDIGDGTGWWTELDYQYRAGRLPGGGTFGFIYGFDGDYARIGGVIIDPGGGGVSVDRKSDAWAGWFSGWQYLYIRGEPPEVIDARDNRQDLEGFGVFLILGLADESTSPITFSSAVGLSGRGMIPGRADDTYGLGYFYNDVQSLASFPILQPRGSTQGLEVYYNLAIAQSIALTFDFQWTRGPFRQIKEAIIVGARLNVRF